MDYDVIWKTKAVKQARKLPAADQKHIYGSVDKLKNRENWSNVKALTNHQYDYRLRVGNCRVLFNCEMEIRIVEIEEVKKRDERTY